MCIPSPAGQCVAAVAPMSTPCVHCCQSGGGRRRGGLCRRPTCFGDLEVRKLYPPKHKNGNRFANKDTDEDPDFLHADTTDPVPLPLQPTHAEPHSEEKILVLQARANAPEGPMALHRPGDNGYYYDQHPLLEADAEPVQPSIVVTVLAGPPPKPRLRLGFQPLHDEQRDSA